MDHHPHLKNPNPNSTHLTGNIDTWLDFEVEDYLVLDDGSEESFSSQNMASSDNSTGGFESASAGATSSNSNIKRKNGVQRRKPDHAGVRVAFRTKSELEVMDDGFKWRKYGKKMVKNSPNPRNYYKCSSGGCNVKKRVEKDKEDPSYVITTYDGVHNHESPCVFYYNHTPLMVPNGWTLQPSPSQSFPC